MIYEIEKYQTFIIEILRRIPILKADQLRRALQASFRGLDWENACEILTALQRRGYVLLSPDGWAMTKGVYKTLSGDRFCQKLLQDLDYRLPNMTQKINRQGVSMDVIDAFWVVIDMMPASINFVVNSQPFVLLFDTDKNKDEISKVYEITKISKSREDSRCELLRQLTKITDPNMQKRTVRIAVIENEKHSWMVPHIGFTFICVLDKNESTNLRIVEKREGEDIWSDV